MKYLLFIVSISLTVCCFGQQTNGISQIKPSIRKIVDSIASKNVLESSLIGYNHNKSAQWERFESLRKLASPKELEQLTDHRNAVVRCYAFLSLVFDADSSVYRILLNHLRDNENVNLLNFDLGEDKKVGDYFLDIGTIGIIVLNDNKLSEARYRTIDSILIYSRDINLQARYNLLANLKPKSEYYKRIKEIACVEKYLIACVPLARYQKKEDIPVIDELFKNKENTYYGICAALEFPDSSFYPKLVKAFKNYWHKKYLSDSAWCVLYEALARYPSQQTLKLFEETLKSRNDFRHNTLPKYLKIAITMYPNPLFESLKSKIHLDPNDEEEVSRHLNIEN